MAPLEGRPAGHIQPDQPVPPPAAIVPVGGDGQGSKGLDFNGAADADEITDHLIDIDTSVGADSQDPGSSQKEVASHNSRRVVISLLAILLAVEVIALGFFAVDGAIKVVDDPALGWATSSGVAPGEHLLPHLDLLRVVGFFGSLIAIIAVLIFAIRELIHAMRQPGVPMARYGRLCVLIVGIVNIIASGTAVAVALQAQNWYNASEFVINTPARVENAGLIALGLTATFVVAVVVLIKASGKKVLRQIPVAVLIAVALGGVQIAVQQVSIGSYSLATFVAHDGPPLFATPLQSGFWTIGDLQNPVSSVAPLASCGSANDCLLFGEGYRHSSNDLLAAFDAVDELTVTTDGGRTWHSWFVGKPLNGPFPLGPTPVCRGASCIGAVLDGSSPAFGVGHVSVLSSGQFTQQVTTGNTDLSWSLSSCPTTTWCAGIDKGNYLSPKTAQAPALITSTNMGISWSSRLLPTSLVPKGDQISPLMSCPNPGHCVLAASLGSSAPTAAERVADRAGSTFLAITTDGGFHWKTSSLPSPETRFTSLACTDSLHCVALASIGDAPSELLRSDDGGLRWLVVTSNLPWESYSFGQLVCTNADRCLVVGSGVSGGNDVMYHTVDAGAAWQRVDMPQVPSGQTRQIYQPSCPTLSFCVATAALRPPHSPLGEGQPVVLATHDGGTTWSQQAFPVPKQLP